MQLWQLSLPDSYYSRDESELAPAIAARRQELGSDLIILGHHYQVDEVDPHADFTGDSLKLSQLAAAPIPVAGGIDLLVALAFAVALLVMSLTGGKRITRREGALLLLGYAGYTTYLLTTVA